MREAVAWMVAVVGLVGMVALWVNWDPAGDVGPITMMIISYLVGALTAAAVGGLMAGVDDHR